MVQDLQHAVKKLQAQETACRVRAAQDKLRSNWKVAPATVHNKIDPKPVSTTYVLQKPDGGLTGNFNEFS